MESADDDVEDMFSSLGEKLGWFQFEDLNSALKSLNNNTKPTKKKKTKKKTEKGDKEKENMKESSSMEEKKGKRKKKKSSRSSIEKSVKKSDSTDSSTFTTTNVTDLMKKEVLPNNVELEKDSDAINDGVTNNNTYTSASPSTATNLKKKEVLAYDVVPERDCEINDSITTNNNNTSTSFDVVKEEPSSKEDSQPSLEEEKYYSSSEVQVKEDSFDVNNRSSNNVVVVGHRRSSSSNNTFSDLSVSDDSVANITSGICKKMQFNSDDSSSLLDSKLEKSGNSSYSSCLSESFKGKSSSEKADSVLSTSDQTRTSDQFDMSTKLKTDVEEMKTGNECAYASLSNDDDDDDNDDDLQSFIQNMLTPQRKSVSDSTKKNDDAVFQSFLKKMLTPQRKSVGDSSTKKPSVFSEFSKISDSSSDSSSDEENNESCFSKKTLATTSHKTNDGRRDRKRNVLSPLPAKEIPKPNPTWALRDKNGTTYSNSPSESHSSSSDDDFQAFLEKMKVPVKETPEWSEDSMKSFIISSDEEEEESLSLYHRIRPISPEIDKSSLLGRLTTPKSRTPERGIRNNDKENWSGDDLPSLTPKVKPSTEIFKKPLINIPRTETKKGPGKKPSLSTSEVTPKRIGLPDLKQSPSTCPNLKSRESLLQRIRPNKPAEGYASFLKSLSNGAAADSIDPNARKYIKQFKQYQEELVAKLFKIYNETVFDSRFPADFSIRFNKRLLTTAGHCILKSRCKNNKKEHIAEICLATKVCDTPERVRDTLIHELCHAAVWVFNGCREGHGPVWKTWARNANRIHPYLPLILRCHSYDIAKKYTYKCVKCAYSFGRHSKSLDTTKKVCGYCKGQFEVMLSSQLNGSGTPNSTPVRAPGKFALFVKEHYGTLKKLEKCSHKEVMQKLGAQFKEAQI